MSHLLDTNVLSETKKPRPHPAVARWLAETPLSQLHISVMTVGEIARGITQLTHRGDVPQATFLRAWLDKTVEKFGHRVVPVTTDVAQEWAAQHPARPVPVADALIAATAKVHGLTLVTRNVKDFEATGVRLLNPFTG
ncbi:MAG: type II toxin-antitoxin system VapC family toxin [Micromonosporaceae bacterium]